MATVRGVAQPGSVLAWGARGREFKSLRPDQLNQIVKIIYNQLSAGFLHFGNNRGNAHVALTAFYLKRLFNL